MNSSRITRIVLLGLFVASLALPLAGCKTGKSDDTRYDRDAGNRSMENQAGTYSNGSGSSAGINGNGMKR